MAPPSRTSPARCPFRACWREIADTLTGKQLDQLVFTVPNGSPLRLSNWRRAVFLPARIQAGTSARFRIHDLRHTAASLMVQAHYDADLRSRLGGL